MTEMVVVATITTALGLALGPSRIVASSAGLLGSEPGPSNGTPGIGHIFNEVLGGLSGEDGSSETETAGARSGAKGRDGKLLDGVSAAPAITPSTTPGSGSAPQAEVTAGEPAIVASRPEPRSGERPPLDPDPVSISTTPTSIGDTADEDDEDVSVTAPPAAVQPGNEAATSPSTPTGVGGSPTESSTTTTDAATPAPSTTQPSAPGPDPTGEPGLPTPSTSVAPTTSTTSATAPTTTTSTTTTSSAPSTTAPTTTSTPSTSTPSTSAPTTSVPPVDAQCMVDISRRTNLYSEVDGPRTGRIGRGVYSVLASSGRWQQLSSGWVKTGAHVVLVGNCGSTLETADSPEPESTVPETTVPEPTAPETTAPETTVPETTAPETTAPETTVSVPGPAVLDTTPSEADLTDPETTTPEPSTTTSEPAAPETTAGEAAAPETTDPAPTSPENTELEATAPVAAVHDPIPETTVVDETSPAPDEEAGTVDEAVPADTVDGPTG